MVALGLAGVMVASALWPAATDEKDEAPPMDEAEPAEPRLDESASDPLADATPQDVDGPTPFADEPPDPEGPVGAPLAGRLAVELWTPRPTIERDEAIDLRVRLLNLGTTALRVLRPVEDHQWGFRVVTYSIGPSSAHDLVAPPWFHWDPRFACLTDADLVTLAPGATLDVEPRWPQQQWSGSVFAPGSHTFTAWYSVRAQAGTALHQAELRAATTAGTPDSPPRERQAAVRRILASLDFGAVCPAPLTIVRR